MKQTFLSGLLLFCIFEVHSQCFVDTEKLNQSYFNLIQNTNSFEAQKAFFNAFPSSWMEYILTYTCNLDMDVEGHIKALENLSLIPDSTYCDKLIHLSIDGKWDADAPYYLQALLRRIIDKKGDVFFARLSKQSNGYQLRFWLFYWSSMLHTEDNIPTVRKDFPKECEQLKIKMNAKYPKVVKIMETALPFALGEVLWPNGVEEYFPRKNKY